MPAWMAVLPHCNIAFVAELLHNERQKRSL